MKAIFFYEIKVDIVVKLNLYINFFRYSNIAYFPQQLNYPLPSTVDFENCEQNNEEQLLNTSNFNTSTVIRIFSCAFKTCEESTVYFEERETDDQSTNGNHVTRVKGC